MNTRSAAPALAHDAGATSNPALTRPRLITRMAIFGAGPDFESAHGRRVTDDLDAQAPRDPRCLQRAGC